MSVTVESGGEYLVFSTVDHEVGLYLDGQGVPLEPEEREAFERGSIDPAVLYLTPCEARAVAARLLVLADECESAGAAGAVDPSFHGEHFN